MAISYSKLWKLLIDHGMSKADLRKAVKVSPITLTQTRKGEPISTATLERICELLNVNFGDIIDYVPPVLSGSKEQAKQSDL